MLEAVGEWLLRWGLPGVAGILWLEGMGLPLPVEVAFLLAGALIASDAYPLWAVALVAWVATMMGNLIGYGVALWGGESATLRLFRLARVPRDRLTALQAWMQRHSLTVLLMTRLLHWGFAPSLWLAGIARLPVGRILLIMAVANLIWTVAWLLLGAYLLRLGIVPAAAVMVGLAVAGLLLQRLRRRRGGSAVHHESEPAPGGTAAEDRAYIERYFAHDARTYDRRERFRSRMRQRLLALAAVRPGERVLDVCTGTGAVALALAAQGARVTGVDLSPDMLALARRKAPAGAADFLEADAAALPFPDGAFDVCTLGMGLHCMPAAVRPRVLAEMARVARRRVALMEPNTPASPLGRRLLARLGRLMASPQYWPDFVATDLSRLAAEAGLVVESRTVFNLGVHQALACRPRRR